MRTLLLMRHAKSDYPAGVQDRERPLAPRGERDAHAAGAWLASTYPRIDEVVVSPATRAQQTWALVAPCVHAGVVRMDPRIYDDWGAQLMDVIADVSNAASVALVVGHNPGIEECALALGQRGDAAARARMLTKYPTSGIAALHVPGSWTRVGTAQLASFTVPRGEVRG